MCFAGLWDCVKYEDTEDKLYTYTVITTDSNKQLNFLHDRMPVILEPDTDAMRLWLDPTNNTWTKELQSILKPYEGELECYQVNKDVGKVGNNSPDFIVPVDSKENKNNIANFFGNAKKLKGDPRKTEDHDTSENHAPMPVPLNEGESRKRRLDEAEDEEVVKAIKIEASPQKKLSPLKSASKKTHSATSNESSTLKKSPSKKPADGMQRITNFFGK